MLKFIIFKQLFIFIILIFFLFIHFVFFSFKSIDFLLLISSLNPHVNVYLPNLFHMGRTWHVQFFKKSE